MFFLDRSEAGEKLAEKLQEFKGAKETLVIGLARGGVVTAAAVAKGLNLPLGVCVVRKVGAPGNPELAIGAVAEKGEAFFNDRLIAMLGVSKEYLLREVEKQKRLAGDRERLYFKQSAPSDLENQTVILVDDGIATGASMKVAIRSIRTKGVKRLILAVPVAAPDSLKQMQGDVDQIVCLHAPEQFEAVGAFFKAFEQVSDEMIIKILLQNKQ